MKRFAIIFAISATVFLSGCGGAPKPAGTPLASTAPVTPPAIPPTPGATSIVGNWQFSATSTTSGTPPVTVAGGISQDGTVLSGAVHVNGSNCVDPMAAMSVTGTVNGDGVSLTATGIDGQAVTFTGNVTPTTFTGTYTIKGSCATGDQGTVAGNIPYIPNDLAGTFTNSAQKIFHLTGDIYQSGSADSEGSFAIGANDPSTFDTPCFSSGTIKPGTFPSGSYILGTWNPDSLEITGTYTISGGTCADKGTAVLSLSSPWDY